MTTGEDNDDNKDDDSKDDGDDGKDDSNDSRNGDSSGGGGVCVSGLRLQLGYCKCMRYQSLVPSR